MNVACPECEAGVELDSETVIGEVLTCGECAVELEVTSLDPVTVVLAPPEEEDWGE